MLVNHRNLHYRYKVFQVAQESRDYTQSKWIFFSALFLFFTEGEKRGNVTNFGNGS